MHVLYLNQRVCGPTHVLPKVPHFLFFAEHAQHTNHPTNNLEHAFSPLLLQLPAAPREKQRNMSYFETISDMPAFEARRTAEANSKDIKKWKEIPTGDTWSTAELYAARLLVRKDAESTHMLPALQNESDKAKEARNQEQIQKLLKGLDEPWTGHLPGPSCSTSTERTSGTCGCFRRTSVTTPLQLPAPQPDASRTRNF